MSILNIARNQAISVVLVATLMTNFAFAEALPSTKLLEREFGARTVYLQEQQVYRNAQFPAHDDAHASPGKLAPIYAEYQFSVHDTLSARRTQGQLIWSWTLQQIDPRTRDDSTIKAVALDLVNAAIRPPHELSRNVYVIAFTKSNSLWLVAAERTTVVNSAGKREGASRTTEQSVLTLIADNEIFAVDSATWIKPADNSITSVNVRLRSIRTNESHMQSWNLTDVNGSLSWTPRPIDK